MKLVDEFKAFAMKGNVVDLAVGVVIGAAFGKIVTSLVADIIMPPIGYLTGGVDFSEKKITLTPADPAHKVLEVARIDHKAECSPANQLVSKKGL